MGLAQRLSAWLGAAGAALARLLRLGEGEPTLQARLRARLGRYARMAGGFAVSVALLGAAALYLAAAASRVEFDTAPAIAAPEGGSHGVAAAAYVFGLQGRRNDLAADRLFAPARLKRREAGAFAAANAAARAYVSLARVRRGAQAPLLKAAREAAQGDDAAAAAAALERLNAGAAGARIAFDPSADGFRVLAGEAAASCAAQAAFLAERVQGGRLAELDEAAFFGARGEALGWLIVLRAAAADVAPAEAVAGEPALARALAALERAAGYDPVLFPDRPFGGALSAKHLALVGLDLAVAAQELAALAAG